MITVLLWKWKQSNYRSAFNYQHVNTMVKMIGRNLDLPHRVLCITDDPVGIMCETYPLWDAPDIIPIKEGKPNCYRRLKVFGDFGRELGDRLLSIDLDTVITKNMTDLVDRKEDFVIWGDTAKGTHYNGGFWLMTPGTRKQVWDTFVPDAPRITSSLKIVGSDQAWISHVLGPGEATWSTQDGVYSYRNHLNRGFAPLPSNAKVVFFHGQVDPWSARARNIRWVRENYR